jgi:AsmA protein
MKKFLIILGVIVLLLVAVVVAVPFIVPKSTLVALVTEQIEDITGRKVHIGGEPDFSIFPEVKLSISDVSLSNAEGGKATNLAEIGSADIEVDLMAAISGNVVVKKFVLINPVIAIEKDKNGRFNFEFGDDNPGDTGQQSDSSSSDGGTGEGLALSLDDVRLENATLIYDDAQTGERQEIKGFNAKLSLPAATGPFDLDANAEWRGRKIEIVAHVDNPMALGEGNSTALNATVASGDMFKVGFEGTAANGASPEGAGKISIDVSDLAGLLAWVEVALGPDVKLPTTIAISGDLTASPLRAALGAASIGFDNNTLTGSLSAGLSGGKPFAIADLTAGELDLRAYLPKNEGAEASGSGSDAAAGPSDWSDDKIDLSGLSAADADIRLKAQKITTGIVDTGKTDVAIIVKGKQASVTIHELALFDGGVTGNVGIDLRKGDPAIAVKLDVAGLQARPALQQFADYGDFLGTVNISIDLATRGDTERKLVSALNGKGNMSVTDGAIIGYNFAAAFRNIGTGGLDMEYDKSAKTDFAEISASFTAKNGLIHNPDLKMNAPLLRVTGKGDIPLPPRTIDYRALPKLVASLTGQGASGDGGLGVPILVTGSWDDPSIQPDLEGVVKGVLEAPGDAIKGVSDTVKGVTEGGTGAVKGVLDSVTGGGSSDATAPKSDDSTGGAAGGAVKKLKGLFGD